jgi:2-polyprenyl-3-methyl-5-hydroxy-6-metoxy-1,4-benzoquinol methylase
VGASVTYVDHVDAAEGMRIYAHHDADRCVTPDRICDAEQMEGFEKESLDFIVSSHVLEHLKNPAGAIVEHMKLLKPGGFWVAAVPNMKCTFDAGRMETSPGHFILDMEDGGESTMSEHRKSWASVEPPHRPPGDYMHVHCWTPEGMTGCLSRLSCIENTFSFEITEHGA